jgi:uncharacterized iron-regulated membrane protein
LTSVRRVWLRIHRWLGLSAGVVLVLVGLSGSFLAFYTQIDRALNADWVTTKGGGQALPMASVIEAAAPAMPGRFLHSVFPPADAEDVHHVWFTPSAQDQSAMWEVLVDPYSGKVLGSRTAVPTMEFTRRNIANTIYTLHFQLFMGDAGSTIVGFAGLFLLLSGISGVLLWWPRGRSFRTGLRFKQGSHGIRLHFDIHRVAGIYSVAVLLVVAFTGVYLTFPDYAKPMVNSLSPLREAPQFDQLPEVSAAPVDADTAIRLALAVVPGARVSCLWLPGASGQSWRVSLRAPDGVAWAGGPGDVWLHPNGGQLLGSRTHAQATAGEVFIAWQLPLHGGSAFGMPGRLLACVLGFVPLLMAITGAVIWWRKRQARRFVVLRPSRQPR